MKKPEVENLVSDATEMLMIHLSFTVMQCLELIKFAKDPRISDRLLLYYTISVHTVLHKLSSN